MTVTQMNTICTTIDNVNTRLSALERIADGMSHDHLLMEIEKLQETSHQIQGQLDSWGCGTA